MWSSPREFDEGGQKIGEKGRKREEEKAEGGGQREGLHDKYKSKKNSLGGQEKSLMTHQVRRRQEGGALGRKKQSHKAIEVKHLNDKTVNL